MVDNKVAPDNQSHGSATGASVAAAADTASEASGDDAGSFVASETVLNRYMYMFVCYSSSLKRCIV